MDIVFRACVVFAFLLLLTRIIGRRELSTLAPFDLILLIILGDAIQQGLTQDDYSLTGAFLAIGTIAVLQVVVSYTSFRIPFVRNVLEGHPIVIIQDGKPIEKNLRGSDESRSSIPPSAASVSVADQSTNSVHKSTNSSSRPSRITQSAHV
jgi:uncharacterized membrane protein YcaP (DUF421 family)